jgi:cell division protein FtsB
MDPRNRDDSSKVGTDGKAVVSNRRSSAVTAVLLFLALGLVMDGILGERGWLANKRGRQQLEAAGRNVEALKRRNEALTEYGQRLREQDPATIEELARRERGFIRPGEKLFIIRDVPKEK